MRKLLYLLLVLSLVSCLKKEIPFEGKDAKSLLVLSSTFSTDSLMKVYLSPTKSVVGKDVKIDLLTDRQASVDVYDGDNVESLIYDADKKAFVGLKKATEGKKYTIKAIADGLDDVEASVFVPTVVEITNVSIFENYRSDSYEDRRFRFSFKDPEAKNYYKVSLFSTYKEVNVSKFQTVEFTSKDDVFKGKSDGIGDSFEDEYSNRFGVFTDDFIGGKDYTIELNLASYNLSTYADDFKLYVSLQSISEDYYLFLKSYELQLEAGDSPFSEPVQIWSNVEGGAGIAAAYSASTKEVIVDYSAKLIDAMIVDGLSVDTENLPIYVSTYNESIELYISVRNNYTCRVLKDGIPIKSDGNNYFQANILGLKSGFNNFDIEVKDVRNDAIVTYPLVIERR